MSDVTVRPASESDLPAVLELYAQPDLDAGEKLPLDEARRIFARFRDYPDYTLYVAERDGVVVGTFTLLVIDNLSHRGSRSALVEAVVVDADLRGGGIGRAMMEEAVAVAKRKGCYKLALSSNLKRERAHAFYETIGYRRHGYSFLTEPLREAAE